MLNYILLNRLHCDQILIVTKVFQSTVVHYPWQFTFSASDMCLQGLKWSEVVTQRNVILNVIHYSENFLSRASSNCEINPNPNILPRLSALPKSKRKFSPKTLALYDMLDAPAPDEAGPMEPSQGLTCKSSM